jgi:hypothetical protein
VLTDRRRDGEEPAPLMPHQVSHCTSINEVVYGVEFSVLSPSWPAAGSVLSIRWGALDESEE